MDALASVWSVWHLRWIFFDHVIYFKCFIWLCSGSAAAIIQGILTLLTTRSHVGNVWIRHLLFLLVVKVKVEYNQLRHSSSLRFLGCTQMYLYIFR